jgi:membrane protease YdiL (CAAX protease family)
MFCLNLVNNMAAAHSTSGEEQSRRSTLRKIFCNQRGLRSGWRLALYLAFIPPVAIVTSRLLSLFKPVPDTLFAPTIFLIVFLPALVMSKIEKRSIGEYGLAGKEVFGTRFLQGCAVGLIEVTALVGFLALVHAYSFGHIVTGGVSLVKWALENVSESIGKALFLQILFRGYTQFTLAEGISFWSAAVVLSALYMVIIATSASLNLIGLPIVFMVGLFFSLTLRRTHSLWFAIGMNAAFDFGATFLYSVPNPAIRLSDHHLSEVALSGSAWLTGGTMGVEGSPLRIVTVGILICLMNKFYPAKTSDSIA